MSLGRIVAIESLISACASNLENIPENSVSRVYVRSGADGRFLTSCRTASLGARCVRLSTAVRFARFSSITIASSSSLRNRYSAAAVCASPLGAAAGVSPKDRSLVRPASCAMRSSSLFSQRLKTSHSWYNPSASSVAGRALRSVRDELANAFEVYHCPPRLIDRKGAVSSSRCVCFVASRCNRLALTVSFAITQMEKQELTAARKRCTSARLDNAPRSAFANRRSLSPCPCT